MGKAQISFLLVLVILLCLSGCNNTAASDSYTQTISAYPEATEEIQPLPTETMEQVAVDPTKLWTTLCEEYIYLRAEPSEKNFLCQIPAGDTFVLEKWHGKYALITYQEMQGYVSSNYIMPVCFETGLNVVSTTCEYTYNQLLQDISALHKRYPDLIRTEIIGVSEAGREIPVIKIGNPNGKHHVLMQGAIHGREHFTAWLLMAVAEYSLVRNYLADSEVCYHIIPMTNPDGVTISQAGVLDEAQTAIYQNDLSAGYTGSALQEYARQWKANALGIDLNRNFPSGWENSLEHEAPSSEKYRGAKPFAAAESRALRDYTLKYAFSATISFHSHGSVIYYQYGDKQPVNSLSYSLAQAVREVTGYIPTAHDGTTGAGYKDWAMDTLGIPSLTVEIGNYRTPLEQRDIYNTFYRCRELFPAIHRWLTENK